MVDRKESRLLQLDDILEILVFLLSAARNVVGGQSEKAGPLLLESAERVISCVVGNEKDRTPEVLKQLAPQIIACRELFVLDRAAYMDFADELIRLTARNMLDRSDWSTRQQHDPSQNRG